MNVHLAPGYGEAYISGKNINIYHKYHKTRNLLKGIKGAGAKRWHLYQFKRKRRIDNGNKRF